MKLTFKQLKVVGKHKFIEENNWNAKYAIPLYVGLALLISGLIMACVQSIEYANDCNGITYALPENAQVLTVTTDGYFVGDVKLKMEEEVEYNLVAEGITALVGFITIAFSLVVFYTKADEYSEKYAVKHFSEFGIIED